MLAAVVLVAAAVVGPLLAGVAAAHAAPDDRATLFFIRTAGTPSGRVEIHTATAASHYQQADLHTTTYFRTTEARQGYFQMIGRTLWFLKVCETGSGSWELHSATPQSGYTSGAHVALTGTGDAPQANLPCDQAKARLASSRVHLAFQPSTPTTYPVAFIVASGSRLTAFLVSCSGFAYCLTGADVTSAGAGATYGPSAGTATARPTPVALVPSSATGRLQVVGYTGAWGAGQVYGGFDPASNRSTVFTTGDAAAGFTDVRDVTGDGVADVTYVKLVAPGTGHVEVFAANGTSPGSLLLASSTWFSPSLASAGTWQLGSAAN
ncbi:hypothetical protein GCM10009814_11990 [Lapillicoccus jejuensis]